MSPTKRRPEAGRAFQRWTDALISRSTPNGYGWVIEGRGVIFTNCGDGAPGKLADQVMLGADPANGGGVVTIVRPETAQRDKGKLTVIGRDEAGRRLLLREGWLKRNNFSRAIRDDFAALTGLQPVALSVDGAPSKRDWFIVADLHDAAAEMLVRTADFALACTRARAQAGGGKPQPVNEQSWALAMDETGKTFTVTRHAETKEVCALQGYVYQALKAFVGDDLIQPTKGGFTIDGLIPPAKLLIEMKTGVSPHDVYEAVGQLRLYPALIGLDEGLTPVLLVPDDPPLKPALAAALDAAAIEIYTYAVDRKQTPPGITFSDTFLALCSPSIERRATGR